jgi:hypothetical protein
MGGRLPGQCGRHPIGSEEIASGGPATAGCFPDIQGRDPSLYSSRSPSTQAAVRAEILRRG